MLRFISKRERIPVPTWGPVLTWIASGAGLMYLLDPAQGHRRRAFVRDKLIHLAHVSNEGARRTKSDLMNRAHGLGIRMHAKARPEEVADEVLVDRVRSKMGVFVSHPRSVAVRVDSGVVTLQGPILEREAKAFVRQVKRMAGVRQLVDQLERHPKPDHVPALQGGAVRRRRAEILQKTWTPGVRFLAGAAGAGLLGIGASKRYRPLAALGVAALLRASLNMPFGQMLQSAQRRVFRSRGTGLLATPGPVAGPPSPPQPTPSEQSENVARSIRE